ncbi:unnamed protein product, partial [marine sediment metagenome]
MGPPALIINFDKNLPFKKTSFNKIIDNKNPP